MTPRDPAPPRGASATAATLPPALDAAAAERPVEERLPATEHAADARAGVPLLLVVPLALSTMALTGTQVVLPLVAVHLRASPFAVGLLLSLLGVVPVFAAVPIGRAVDRLGYSRPALGGVTLMVAGGLVGALWQAMGVLAVTSVLVGSGWTVAFVALNNAVGHASPGSRRTQAFGLLALGLSVANLLGPVIAGYAIDHGGYALAFAALAAGPVLSGATLLLPWAPRIAGIARESAPRRPGSVLELFAYAPLRAVLIVSALMSVGWDTFLFMAPLYGIHRGLSATAIGLFVGAFGAGSAVVRLAIPFLMRALDERRVLYGSLGGTAACFAILPFARTLVTLLPLAFVFGTLLGTGFPMAMSLTHRAAPPARTGEAVGVRASITSATHTALPVAFGAAGAALGLGAVFWMSATLLAFGTVYARRALRE